MRGEGMAQRMRRRAIGKPERAAQTRDRELDDPWAKWPALGAKEQGLLQRERVRANRDVSFDCLADRRDDGHGPGLLALAGDRQNVARADRRLGALDRQGFGNAQARAIEQAQHGGIARDDPVRPVFSGPCVHANHLACRIDAQWLWQAALDPWRAQAREGERLALAIAFKIT